MAPGLYVTGESPATDIVEVATKIGEVLRHLNRSIEPSADFLQFERAMKHGFGLRGSERESCIPRTTPIIVEAAATRSRMTKRCHDDRRHGLAYHPFSFWNGMQNPQLYADAIVAPSFELEYGVQIFRRRHRVENADRRIPARYQTMGPAPRKMS